MDRLHNQRNLELTKEEIFEILKVQNTWFHDRGHNLAQWDFYKNLIPNDIESKPLTLVQGIGKLNKVNFLRQIEKILVDSNDKKMLREQILYIKLDDYHFINMQQLNLLESALEVYREKVNANKHIYYMIDEMQDLDFKTESKLMDFIKTQNKKSVSFIITSSLVNKEGGQILLSNVPFAAFLSHRNISVNVSNSENIHANRNLLKKYFNEYLQYGSIADLLEQKKDDEFTLRNKYIEFFENILFSTVVDKYKIRNLQTLKQLSVYLANRLSQRFSYNQIAKELKISINTVREYVNALIDSGLFFILNEFSHTSRQPSTSQAKIFMMDTGLANALNFISLNKQQISSMENNLLRNITYLELKRRNVGNDFEIYYHKEKRECDFVIYDKNKNKVVELIQVTESMPEAQTVKSKVERDPVVKALVESSKILKSNRAMIITYDDFFDFKISDLEVEVRPIWLVALA